jgi:MFS family permease
LVFNVVTIALPKIIDERLGFDMSLVAIGGIATVVLLFGAVAQVTVGRLLEKFPPHLVFAAVAALQFAGVAWVAYATGSALLVALAVAISAIYAQVTVTDFVIARYSADAWRARIYSVRYFVTYVVSGAAAWMISSLYGRGGFDLVLGVTAVVALGFVVGTVLIAVLVHGVERERSAVQPAE